MLREGVPVARKGRSLKVEERLKLLERAKVTGNVVEACREFGVSRPCFYKWRARFARAGLRGLEDQPKAPKHHPRKLDIDARKAIVSFALMHPWKGCHALSKSYFDEVGKEISGVAIHRILKEHGLETLAQRIEQATIHLVNHPELRRSDTWDYLRQRNPLIDVLGPEGGDRGGSLHLAFLPHPQRLAFKTKTTLEGEHPWAFILMDGGSGYTFGAISKGEVRSPFWNRAIEDLLEVHRVAPIHPRVVQIGSYTHNLTRDLQEALHGKFPQARYEIIPQEEAMRSGWVSIFARYLRKFWGATREGRGRSDRDLDERFRELVAQFNSDHVNRGFPNFGEPPEHRFWPHAFSDPKDISDEPFTPLQDVTWNRLTTELSVDTGETSKGEGGARHQGRPTKRPRGWSAYADNWLKKVRPMVGTEPASLQFTQHWEKGCLYTQTSRDGCIEVWSPEPDECCEIKLDRWFDRPLERVDGEFFGLWSRVDRPRKYLTLLSSRDGVEWSRRGQFDRDTPHGPLDHVIPMGGSRFILVSNKAFILDGRSSPFAIGRLGDRLELVFDRLLDLGLKHPWFVRLDPEGESSQSVETWIYNQKLGPLLRGLGKRYTRCKNAILFPDYATGWMWALRTDTSEPELRCIRPSRLGDDDLEIAWQWNPMILGIQPLREDKFLIASRSRDALMNWEGELLLPSKPAESINESVADGEKLLQAQKATELRFPRVVWSELDPETWRSQVVNAPEGGTEVLMRLDDLRNFTLRIRSDSQVSIR